MTSSPSPIVLLNDKFLPLEQAQISPLDRGFLFADSVYEVMLVRHGSARNLEYHLQRLQQSLDTLGIANPLTADQWQQRVQELITRNFGDTECPDCSLYLQISRGATQIRAMVQPQPVQPTLFLFLVPLPQTGDSRGIVAATAEDRRWHRCNIKATGLTGALLTRRQFPEAAEVIMHRDGEVTEGTSSNVFAVIDGEVVTPPLSEKILPGVTRLLLLQVLRESGIPCTERLLQLDELLAAEEIWLTSTLRGLEPITELDGRKVGDGSPGPLWRQVEPLLEQQRGVSPARSP